MQKIVLFTNSEVGERVAEAELNRGYSLTTIVSGNKEFNLNHPNLIVVKGDLNNREELRTYAQGHDVIIFIHEPSLDHPGEHINIVRNILAAAKSAGIQHILITGHPFAQNLEILNKPQNFYKPLLKAQLDVLQLLLKEMPGNWTYIHSMEERGWKKSERKFNTKELMFSQPDGDIAIPVEECIAIILDEAERSELEMLDVEEEDRED